jgi:hypothetical protein
MIRSAGQRLHYLGCGLISAPAWWPSSVGDRIEEAASEATEFGELCEPRDGGGAGYVEGKVALASARRVGPVRPLPPVSG